MSDDPSPCADNPASAVPKSGVSGGDEIPQAVTKSDDLDALLAEVSQPPEWLDAFLASQAEDLAQLLTDLGTLDLTSLDDLPLPSLDDLGLPPLTL
jgi:hypothetical protein